MKITVQMTIQVDVSTSWPLNVTGDQVYREAKQSAENIVNKMISLSRDCGHKVTRKSTDKVMAVLVDLEGTTEGATDA